MAASRRTSTSSSKGTSNVDIEWNIITPTGPPMAYHVGCIINDTLYVHGGINKAGSTTPLSKIYKMDLSTNLWQEVREPNSPALSHHVCLVLHDRYMLLIGGWDGRKRTTELYAFDTTENSWMSLKSSGFPDGAGLSSHAAVIGENGDILVMGREGSLRTQRRSGNAFLLKGSISSGVFKYTDFPIGIESRSGHTAHILHNVLVVLGGRNDKLIEFHGGYKSGVPICAPMSKLTALLTQLKPMSKPPGGRKHHVAVSGSGALFVHGGETFEGVNRPPVSDIYMMTSRPTMKWYHLGSSGIGRAGHVCCYYQDRLILHGGMGARKVIYGDAFQLQA